MTLHFRDCLADLGEGLGKGAAWFVSMMVYQGILTNLSF